MCVVYVLLYLIFEYILGLRHIGTFDELFLYDTGTNKSVITAIMFFDKFDGNKILTHLKNRMLRYRRLRSRFVQVFDSYYLKEFGIHRLLEVVEDAFVKVEVNAQGAKLNTEQALVDFLTHEVSTPFDKNGPLYKVFVVEDFSETESIVMCKCHHALADGMSLIGLIACMQDHYNISQLYEFRPYIPCYKKLCMWLCMPFCMVTALFHVLCKLNVQNNALTL